MNPAADVLALASLEVDIGKLQEGDCITVKWRGKPVFIRYRSGTLNLIAVISTLLMNVTFTHMNSIDVVPHDATLHVRRERDFRGCKC